MAAKWTNKGKARAAKVFLRGESVPTEFRIAFVTSAVAPTVDTNVFSELTEIAAGNGYSAGGQVVERSATGWPTLTEDDTNDLFEAIAKSLTWTPSGGSIPASGNPIAYAVLLDDNATPGNREVLAFWELGSLSFADGSPFTLSGAKLRGTE